jgi:PAS domain S-box-containing protein
MNDALTRAALAVSDADGNGVFDRLAGDLAAILAVDVGFVAVFADSSREEMRMLAFHLDGKLRKPFTYALPGTPCERVVGQQFHCVPAGARSLFPRNDLFARIGLESYAAYPINDGAGQPLGLIGAMHRSELSNVELCEAILKIFALRAATEIERERFEASEAQYHAIFNATADSMVLRDAEFRVVDVNPAYEAMSGRRRDEVLGRSDLTMSPAELNEHVRALHQRALAGETVLFEALATRKSGERFDIETRGVPILHQGRPHVLYVGRDITARKRAEQALRASEEQYRAIFKATADALVLRDAQFRIVDVNPAYEARSGYSREEVIGRDDVVANPGDVEERIRALHVRALAGEPVMLETVRMAKDGSRRDVELRGVPILHRGEPHVLYIGRDISERKRAEEQRTQLEAQLRQAQRMEAIGHLTGGIAHDFNNLLASIMGYLVLAAERDSAAADAKLGGYLEQALLSSRRARDLIRQMLTFSRGQRASPRAVALGDAVRESLKLLRSSLPSSLELTSDLQGAPAVMLDPVQLDQVMLNLAINARDAMAGVGRIEIRAGEAALQAVCCASCRKSFSGTFAELSLADNGPGIPATVLERMFEPFFTTKEVGRGVGMGLATVHGIVHEHGGHVLVDTAPGRGTRFRILLPVLPAEAATAAARGPGPAKTSRSRLSGRVLVVDDEASVADFMRELLQSWGLEATAINDPLRAKHAVEGCDLVITDQTMPGVSGFELARELLAQRPGLPVILYSGHSDRITQHDIESAGIRALLHKPVEPEQLYGILWEISGKSL